MENKNVVGPAGGNYGLRIQADKNVKKLTVKYANKIPVNKNKTQAHTTTLYTVAFESISIGSYGFLFKKTRTYIHLSYVLSSKAFPQNLRGGKQRTGRWEARDMQGRELREELTFHGETELHVEHQTYGSCMKLQDRQTSAAPFCDHKMREMQKQCLGKAAPRSTQPSNNKPVFFILPDGVQLFSLRR